MGFFRHCSYVFGVLKNYVLQDISYFFSYRCIMPTYFFVELNSICSLNCKMCNKWKNSKSSDELNIEEKLKLIHQIKKINKNISVSIGGSEPFIDSGDFFKLVKTCKSENLYCGTNSNGYLINKKMADLIKNSGLDLIEISLDGTKKTHDFLRGKDGVFDRAVMAINYLVDSNSKLPVNIVTVISGFNIGELKYSISLAKELKVDNIMFQPLMPTFDLPVGEEDVTWRENLFLLNKKRNEVKKVMDELIRMKHEVSIIGNSVDELKLIKKYLLNPSKFLRIPCYSGVKNIIVDSRGFVRNCYKMDSLGNIRDSSLLEILNSKRYKESLKRIKKCRMNCRISGCNKRSSLFQEIKLLTFWKLKYKLDSLNLIGKVVK